MHNRILVIEHHLPSLELMALGLEQYGFVVTRAPSAAAGLAAVEDGRIDLVCVNQMLRGLDGYSVCRDIRRTSAVPILFISSDDDSQDAVAALEAGADQLLCTPFNLAELRDRVCALLGREVGAA